jgi:hypothetical protein
MRAKITNYRGCSSADFPIDRITLIGGPNAAGKTSIAQALGAALTGEAIPVRGVRASSAGQLVRGGTAAGQVQVVHQGGQIVIDWPKAKALTEGRPPYASPFAAGLSCVLNLPGKERPEVLSRYLKSEPERKDLESALADLELSADHLDKLWSLIQQQGWDGACANAKEKGAKLKGQWEEFTGERYGSKKADAWLPADWEPVLDGASEDQLQAQVTDARDALEGAIASEAVSGAKIQELEDRAARAAEIKPFVEEAKILRDEAAAAVEQARAKVSGASADPALTEALDAARSTLAALPAAESGKFLTCPHCRKSVAVVDGRLLPAAEPLPEDEIKSRKLAIEQATDKVRGAERAVNESLQATQAEAREKLQQAQAELEKAGQAHQHRAADLGQAEAAGRELSELKNRPAGSSGDVQSCRNELALAEDRLKAWQRKTAADNRHYNIGVNQQLVAALSPDGVRLRKLEQALAGFNTKLAGLDHLSGWGVVSIDKDLDACLNGTPYHLLSKSERWRVRTTLQLMMAVMDASQAVVIDGADILVDKALRNGLFSLLRDLDIPAVVCMALRGPDELPNVDAADLGQAYWMADGVLVPRAEVV